MNFVNSMQISLITQIFYRKKKKRLKYFCNDPRVKIYMDGVKLHTPTEMINSVVLKDLKSPIMCQDLLHSY